MSFHNSGLMLRKTVSYRLALCTLRVFRAMVKTTIF